MKWMTILGWISANCMCILATLQIKSVTDLLIQAYPAIQVSQWFPFVFAGVTLLATNLFWLERAVLPITAEAANATTGVLVSCPDDPEKP